jgi:membrane protein implicated in regulation of membrane protease activity
MAAGVVLVLAYNLELFNGALHTDLGFALAWGAFPAAVGYVAQAPPWTVSGTFSLLLVALAATALSAAQRRLSTPARALRREITEVNGTIEFANDHSQPIDRDLLLAPLDGALKLLSVAVPAFAAALLLARWAAH